MLSSRAFVLALSFITAPFAQAAIDVPVGRPRPAAELPPARSSQDPVPTASSPLIGRRLRVVRQAGVGGPTAYARVGVLELGGAVNFTHAGHNTLLSVSPSVGWFLFDNFELSLLTQVSYSRQRTLATSETASKVVEGTYVAALLEPSVHLPLNNQLFILGGVGVGIGYRNHSGVGLAVAPRIGFNILVGRSGILTPSATLTWSSNRVEKIDGETAVAVATAWSANLGYSVMF